MRIKFITINIWQGGNLLGNLIEFLKKENPDIIAMQEAYNGKESNLDPKFRSVDVLKAQLPLPYSSFAPQIIDVRSFGKIEQGNAVLSKFPIASQNVLFYDVPFGERYEETETDWTDWPCNLQHVEIIVNEKILNIFNTHGPWYLNGNEDTKRRLAMSRKIIEQVKDKQYVVLAGDFNVRPTTQTIVNIEQHLINVFDRKLKSTFNMKRKINSGYAGAVVDMIFVSSDVNILKHSCPQVDISDHLPLVCKFLI